MDVLFPETLQMIEKLKNSGQKFGNDRGEGLKNVVFVLGVRFVEWGATPIIHLCNKNFDWLSLLLHVLCDIYLRLYGLKYIGLIDRGE